MTFLGAASRSDSASGGVTPLRWLPTSPWLRLTSSLPKRAMTLPSSPHGKLAISAACALPVTTSCMLAKCQRLSATR
jgi:hypothetical protein